MGLELDAVFFQAVDQGGAGEAQQPGGPGPVAVAQLQGLNDQAFDQVIQVYPVRGKLQDRFERALEAVRAFKIAGAKLKTNLPLHERILQSEAFERGELSTLFLEKHAKP